MKSVGQLLKQARITHGYTRQQLAERIKIRPEYLAAIESDRFHELPSATFVKGFIQSYAKAVSVKPQTALAVFRRDFDQNQQGKIIPRGVSQPLHTPSRFWRPQTTTFLVALTLVFVVGVYLFAQFVSYSKAPAITLLTPPEAATTPALVDVKGKTSADATVTVNNQPISIDQEGRFETTLNLSPGEHTIIVKATDRKGRERVLGRTVTVTTSQ